MPLVAGLDPDVLEPDALGARPPAGGDQQAVAAELLPAERDHELVVLPADSLGHLAEAQLDAVVGQRLPQPIAQRSGLVGKDVLLPLDQGDLGSHPAHRLAHLDPHRPAAQDEHPLRDLGDGGGLAVGPIVVELAQAVDRRDEGVGAGRDHDLLGGHLPLADRHAFGPAIRASPRSRSMPSPSSHFTWPLSW